MYVLSRAASFRLVILASTFTAQPAFAQIQFNATTTGGPTWNRPVEGIPPVALSAVAATVPYYAYSFSVANGGYYDFLSTATTPANWDNYTFLYQNAFDPTKPLNNVLLGNDDFTTMGRSGFNGVSLLPQTTYYFVTTGFSNTDGGTFTGTIKPSVSPPNNTYTYGDTTAGKPTWNRPIANGSNPPTALSTFAKTDPFSVFKFNVTVSGSYNLVSTVGSPSNWDNYTFLYKSAFDPTKPLMNILIGNDDLTGTGVSGFNSLALLAGTTYYFVTTGYDNTDFGSFTNTIQGPGTVVPEPGPLALLAVILPGSWLLRRRSRRLPLP